jgi:hypothetical protein
MDQLEEFINFEKEDVDKIYAWKITRTKSASEASSAMPLEIKCGQRYMPPHARENPTNGTALVNGNNTVLHKTNAGMILPGRVSPRRGERPQTEHCKKYLDKELLPCRNETYKSQTSTPQHNTPTVVTTARMPVSVGGYLNLGNRNFNAIHHAIQAPPAAMITSLKGHTGDKIQNTFYTGTPCNKQH